MAPNAPDFKTERAPTLCCSALPCGARAASSASKAPRTPGGGALETPPMKNFAAL
jgi:hypothetical protein